MNRNNRECVPFSMTGTELLARLRQWLVDASNCTDQLNATTQLFFDEIEELCKELQLNIRIFHNKNVENEDGEIHHMVQNWMRGHLQTLRKKINGHTTNADHDILNRLFEVFNTVIFGGALPARLCSWNFHRKDSKPWEDNQRVGSTWDWYLPDYRFPGIGTRSDGALTCFDLYEFPKEEDETSHSSVKRLLQYLGTIFHEMVHCLVFVYVCGCSECRIRLDNPNGSTGHALKWAEMAREIEVFALKMLNINLNLNVCISIGFELFATKESPDRWPLEELGIGREDLEHSIEWARKKTALDALRSRLDDISLDENELVELQRAGCPIDMVHDWQMKEKARISDLTAALEAD